MPSSGRHGDWVQVMRELLEYARYLEKLAFDDDTEGAAIVAAQSLILEAEETEQ